MLLKLSKDNLNLVQQVRQRDFRGGYTEIKSCFKCYLAFRLSKISRDPRYNYVITENDV